jgi:hypothetical protein
VCTVVFPTAGSHTLSAYYVGDSTFLATATTQAVTAVVGTPAVPAPLLDRWALLLLAALFAMMGSYAGCVNARGRR